MSTAAVLSEGSESEANAGNSPATATMPRKPDSYHLATSSVVFRRFWSCSVDWLKRSVISSTSRSSASTGLSSPLCLPVVNAVRAWAL